MPIRRSYSKPIELRIDSSNVQGNIPYKAYVKGEEGQCWFCGQRTKHYRSFAYEKGRSTIAGLGIIKNTHETIVLKLYTCQECKNAIDNVKNTLESLQVKIGWPLFIVIFIPAMIVLKCNGANWFASIFFGMMIGAIGHVFAIPLSKYLANKKTQGGKEAIRRRLDQHPEVKAVHEKGFEREYD